MEVKPQCMIVKSQYIMEVIHSVERTAIKANRCHTYHKNTNSAQFEAMNTTSLAKVEVKAL